MGSETRSGRLPVPDWLAQALRVHRDTHGPHYHGHLSDHLPMALLAMWAAGVDRSGLERYAARYRDRLDSPVRHGRSPPAEFADAMGHLEAYGSLLAFFDRRSSAVERGGPSRPGCPGS